MPNNQKPIKTFPDLNNSLLQIAELQLSVDQANNRLNTSKLKMEEEYQKEVGPLQEEINSIEKEMEKFCKSKKKEFADKKSRSFTFGSVGFRKGKKTLALLNSKIFNWEKVANNFLRTHRRKYVEEILKLFKVRIIADYEQGKLSDDDLAENGVKINQKERFFYELNMEEVRSAEGIK